MTGALAEAPALSTQRPQERHFLHRVEDAAVSLVLAAMVLIPLLEAVLRRTLHTGIPAST